MMKRYAITIPRVRSHLKDLTKRKMNIIQSPSPNFSRSSHGKTVVMIHKTLGLMPGTLYWLQSRQSQASSQYLITKKGVIYQLAKNTDTAWHAGRIYNPSDRAKKVMLKTNWGTYMNPNKYCIGIENEALLGEPITPEQLKANIWLFKRLKEDVKVLFDGSPSHFLTHRDTSSYKPDMEDWRFSILEGVANELPNTDCKVVLDNWGQFRSEIINGQIVISRRPDDTIE